MFKSCGWIPYCTSIYYIWVIKHIGSNDRELALTNNPSCLANGINKSFCNSACYKGVIKDAIIENKK